MITSIIFACAVAALFLGYRFFAAELSPRCGGRPQTPLESPTDDSPLKGLPVEEVCTEWDRLSPFAKQVWISERVERKNVRVLLIGINGADWDIIMPLIEKGELGNFQRLLKTGVHGYLKSMHPILSPLIWMSIATGKIPEKHGILDFFCYQCVDGKEDTHHE